jgi:3-oxoacyl-[acyl-carrier-protein] synthase II
MVSAARSASAAPIAITGLGLVSALGFGVEATWGRLLAGESAIRELPPERFALPIALPVRLGAEVPRAELAERIRAAVPRASWNTSAPVCHVWLLAALEALAGAGLWNGAGTPLPDAARTGIYAGTGGGAHGFAEAEYIRVYTAEKAVQRDVSRFAIPMYMASSLASQLSLLTGIRGPALAVSSACSSGSSALLAALDALRLGRVERAVAGGADLTLTAATLKGFANLAALSTDVAGLPWACRPFDERRGGLVLGEGAACLVLERAEAARRRGVQPLALLLGGSAGSEAHHLLAPRDDGAGMAECMEAALADAGTAPERVRHVYAHGTGTRFNDACEAAALARVLPHGPTVSASKAQLGHTMGAAGAIDAVLAVCSLRTGRAPGMPWRTQPAADCPVRPAAAAGDAGDAEPAHLAVLVNAFAFGGHNTSLLLGPAPPAATPDGSTGA